MVRLLFDLYICVLMSELQTAEKIQSEVLTSFLNDFLKKYDDIDIRKAYEVYQEVERKINSIDYNEDWQYIMLYYIRQALIDKKLFDYTYFVKAAASVLYKYIVEENLGNPIFCKGVSSFIMFRKRNGSLVPYLKYKIHDAIKNANKNNVEIDFDKIDLYLHNSYFYKIKIQDASSGVSIIVPVNVVHALVVNALAEDNQYVDVAYSYLSYTVDKLFNLLSNTEERSNVKLKYVIKHGVRKRYNINDIIYRIRFASVGLELPYDEAEWVQILLAGIPEVVEFEDYKNGVIMNAKKEVVKTYKVSYFAARIMLTFIYEEVFGWNIVKHGYDNGQKLNEMYRRAFIEYIKRMVSSGRLDERLSRYDLNKLAAYIDYKYDMQFTILGISTLYDRYFLHDFINDTKVRLEAPQFFWMRVAMGQFINEGDNVDINELASELFLAYVERRFCSSTPTLFNSGTKRPQLSSCYVYYVDDSIESIMEMGIAKASYLSKWAGGLGGSWTQVRGLGAIIKGTGGRSNGVIPFLKIHNDMLVAVNQGGKRNGSGAVYLEVWHSDIYSFIELRRNTGDERRRTHDTNTAVWIPDLFMKRVLNREHWTLFHSNEVSDLHHLYGQEFEKRYLEYEELAEKGVIYGKRVEAIDLWRNILRMLYETGHPWITFKDACNYGNPQDHVGVIHSSNLCTEITLNTSNDEVAVCNLGSVVLDTHVDDNGVINEDLLARTIKIAIRALDNVIDINFYPIPEAERSNKLHRPIGLGVMGLHYALYKAGIPYDSDEATQFGEKLIETVSYYAHYYSVLLSKEKGAYSTFEGSKWSKGWLPCDYINILEEKRGLPTGINGISCNQDRWKELRRLIKMYGIRNSNVMAIAPTATIANIMGTSPSTEPLFTNLYVKSNFSGDFVIWNHYLEDYLRKHNLWQDNVIKLIVYYDGDIEKALKGLVDEDTFSYFCTMFKTAFQVSQFRLIEQAAYRQKWIDQSQSLNIFYSGNSLKELSEIYLYAWQRGLKTTYYLRTIGASRIEKSTVHKSEIAPEQNETYLQPACRLDDPNCESCQ